MTATTDAYGNPVYSMIIDDGDARTVKVSDDGPDAAHISVGVTVPVESDAHMPVDHWSCDTWTVHFTERYDADGNPANLDA